MGVAENDTVAATAPEAMAGGSRLSKQSHRETDSRAQVCWDPAGLHFSPHPLWPTVELGMALVPFDEQTGSL